MTGAGISLESGNFFGWNLANLFASICQKISFFLLLLPVRRIPSLRDRARARFEVARKMHRKQRFGSSECDLFCDDDFSPAFGLERKRLKDSGCGIEAVISWRLQNKFGPAFENRLRQIDFGRL